VYDLYIFFAPVSSAAMLDRLIFITFESVAKHYFNNHLYYKYSFYNNVLDHE